MWSCSNPFVVLPRHVESIKTAHFPPLHSTTTTTKIVLHISSPAPSPAGGFNMNVLFYKDRAINER